MKNIKTAFALLLSFSLGNSLYATEAPSRKLTGQIEKSFIQDVFPTEAFMNQALLYGLKEVQKSGIAAQNAGNEKIKRVAKSALDLHTAANKELIALAKIKNITLTASKPDDGQRPDGRVDSAPTTLQDTSRNQNQGEAGNTGQAKDVMIQGFKMLRDADIQESISKLKAVKGENFDNAYLASSIQDYQNIVALFEAGSKSADKEVKAFSKKYLTKFKAHLSQVTAMVKG
ncbi:MULTISPECIES: DUF4142 domain-containing protein [Pedobacter]|uniref:DUF4142 domain-containing protein n=1 Tax=Pedobacter TaxID=84567 RepID=UPI0011FCD4E4|nr:MULTISPECIES: DUF4142 domain-containing protein [Pedobacter]RZK91482.1 MAG: DUF4142 domain-containing protein [Pedobacter sp.]